MKQVEDNLCRLTDFAGKIVRPHVRELFIKLCREVLLFSKKITVEIAPFEIRFSDDNGFYIAVSPYREIFLVSIGSTCPCDIRVSDANGYFSALDISLNHYLEVHSKCTAAAVPGSGKKQSMRQ